MHHSLDELRQKWPKIVLAASVILILDQLSKWMAMMFISQELERNAGVSFGFLRINQTLLALSLMVLVLILGILFEKVVLMHPVFSGVFLGAVLSNLIDRLTWGGVRDWLPVPFTSLKNNLADWCIVILLAGLIYQELHGWLPKKVKKNK